MGEVVPVSAELECLLRLCETAPEPTLFGVISDLYADAGDERLAFAFGWMCRKGKFVWTTFAYQGDSHALPAVLVPYENKVTRATFLEAVGWLADRLEAVRNAL